MTSETRELAYASQPFAQTHPRRLATIAWLHGLTSAAPASCRVLELGCASGGNLNPMAWQLPSSRFVGIDISATAIDAARRDARECRLANVEYLCHDIATPAPELGPFDYVIAHGLFSWIGAPVRERFWQWLATHLAPNGLAYVSYNVMPGWSFRGAVRDLMRFSASPGDPPIAQVASGRELLELAARARPPERSPFGPMLAAEVQRLTAQPDDYVWHEFFATDNCPLYFGEFVSQAESHGLQFAGEAEFGAEAVGDLPREAIARLPSADSDWRRREQMLDFFRWQVFRQSLLCRADCRVAREVSASRVEALFVAGDLTSEPSEDSHAPAGSLTFVARQSRLTSNHPLTKVALGLLGATYPRHWSFDELLDASLRQLASPVDAPTARRELAELLLRAYATRLVELAPDRPPVGAADAELVRASALVRRLALVGKPVVNRLHQLVAPGGLERFVLSLLDGRSRDDVFAAFEFQARQSVALVDEHGRPMEDTERIRSVLRETLNRSLRQLERLALIEPNS